MFLYILDVKNELWAFNPYMMIEKHISLIYQVLDANYSLFYKLFISGVRFQQQYSFFRCCIIICTREKVASYIDFLCKKGFSNFVYAQALDFNFSIVS